VDPGWVALLRAVNVGGRNVVPMAGLRGALEEVDCSSVATYIQSGNVVFGHKTKDRAALAKELEALVQKTFGVSAAVVLRTFAEIRKLAAAEPFGGDAEHTHVAFLVAKPARTAVTELKSLDLSPEAAEVVGMDVFLHYPNGLGRAKLTGSLLERTLGVPGTVRNWRTVTRLAEMTESA
jgi:uncharacterized protein (DUF1697 family)